MYRRPVSLLSRLHSRRARQVPRECDYRAIFEHSREAILVTSLSGEIVAANQPAREMFGMTLAELRRMGQEALWDHSDPRHWCTCGRSGSSGTVTYEGTCIRKDGRRFHAEISAVPLRRERQVLLILRDVTERKQAEEERRQRNQRHRMLVETMLHGVVHQDSAGKVIAMNPAAEQILGKRREQFLGSSSVGEERLTIREDGSPFPGLEHPAMVALRTGAHVRGVVMGVFNPECGGYRWIRVDAVPVLDGSAVSEVYTVFEDITERKQAQDAVQRQAHLLTGINRVLESSLHADSIEDLGERCLRVVEEITDSKIGFIAEVGTNGLLHGIAISNPSWAACRMNDPHGERKLPQDLPIRGIVGRVVQDGKSVIANRPHAHPDFVGLPEGHPPLSAFLGVPLLHADKTIGMIGVGNREGGYTSREQEALEALAPALASAIARRRAEDAEERLRALMNHSPSLVSLKDELGRYVYLNDAYEQQFATAKNWFGKTDFDLWPKESAEMFQSHDAEVLQSGRTKQFLEDSTDLKGNRYCWLCYKFPFTDSRGRRYVGGISIDATARVCAEEALKEADRRKDEFLAVLAHELRNPMAAINAAGNLLCRPGIDGHKAEIAKEALQRRIGQMARLVDDLLDVSRITRGRIELAREHLDLESVITQATEAARGYFEEREQELVVRITDSLPVFGDPMRLEQVITNLLTNASRYSERGQRATLSAFRQGGSAVVRMEDAGIGIARELLPRIFEPFAQAENTMARTRGGLGLGLTIVKTLCEMHGGNVSVTSEGEGKGSCFEVRLPLREGYGLMKAERAAPPRVESLSVLLVEDHADTALMQAAMLELEGHTVDIASDGFAAVDKALAIKPDVIILDIGLPGLDGYQVAKRLRKAGLADTLLIAATGYGQERDVRRAHEAGIDHHLLKPIDYEKLAALMAGPQNTPAVYDA